ncbi:RNA polymerase II subunit A C-terminal domain phosphatase [Nakaseomyces bracarensis]|uniref:RNA polymerase II subunit A C-terminal domain phosphatase n=1 Tax=Nakaseomyces bracarensis TaxID=273131 RepID=A0ABR4NZQ2_9SACH
MTTPVIAPEGLPYPITIDELMVPTGSYVEKGQRLFAYKFWYVVEIANSPDDSVIGSEGLDVEKSKRTVRESIEFFEAPFEGDLVSWNVDEHDEIPSPNIMICEVKRPCNHDIIYGGLCTMCGKEVSEYDQVDANIAISHNDTNLRVSRREARDLDNQIRTRLRKEKKLVLVVDLDQTVIHCGVDPTIGEWKNDPTNPNYDTLKDVKSFSLEEEPILPLLYMGPKLPARKCWYYVKIRPGLKEFFEKVSPLYEMHIYTMATRAYALEIAKIIDPDGSLFGDRILSRDENGSLTQKSLQRLFPTDQSMVVVIDDRGDVWNWCPNLIKVVPYNFFVGVGDINSNFLPKQQTTMLQLGRRARQKMKQSEELLTDIIDTEKKLQEKIDEEVKRQEEKLSHQIATNEENNDKESKEKLAKKLEFSASLEVQQQNRPLAKLQKHLHDQRLLIDDDDELFYLKNTLKYIHDEYYRLLDESKDEEADITILMPKLKQKVFKDCHFVFSGLIPLGTDIQRSDIVIWTNLFGADSTPDITRETTHVITKTPGTYKARLAKTFNPDIKIVHPDWIFECLASWKLVDEKPYLLIVDQPVSELELKEFEEQLERRKIEELKKSEEGDEFERSPVTIQSEPTMPLFGGDTSWLNDDDDEINYDDEDDEGDEDEDQGAVGNEEEKDGHTAQKTDDIGASDQNGTDKESNIDVGNNAEQMDINRKRSLDTTDDELDGENKKPYIAENKQEDSDSDLEEELLNVLDSDDEDD